jgi:asparagine synthase (glutamine-hydrolysing)
LDFAGKSPLTEVDDWLELLEMPYKFFENSFWIKGVFAKCCEQDAGVLLTGAGGNHSISWGPAVDYYALLLRKLRWIHLYRELLLFSRRKGIRRSRLLPIIGRRAMQYLVPSLADDEPDMPLMLHPDFARRTNVDVKIREIDSIWSAKDAIEAREHHYQSPHIANLVGTKGTKLSLRYNLREFDPTNDPRVVRFCLAVPLEQYVRNGYDRALIRRSTERLLPDKVRLNQRTRGIQAADWVHRMISSWPVVQKELRQLCQDSLASGVFNTDQIMKSLSKVGDHPRPEYAIDPDMRFLMRCLIVYRFLQRF